MKQEARVKSCYKKMLDKLILKSLRKKYEAEIDGARTNVEVYLQQPVGVAEHPDILASVDSQMTIMAEARDKLQELDLMEDKNFPETVADIINH